jgi:hypothetical protein
MFSNLHEARAEALFASTLQRSQHPTNVEVRATVKATIRQFGVRGCAGAVAAEYARHPDTAVARMAWCNTAVDEAWPARTLAGVR